MVAFESMIPCFLSTASPRLLQRAICGDAPRQNIKRFAAGNSVAASTSSLSRKRSNGNRPATISHKRAFIELIDFSENIYCIQIQSTYGIQSKFGNFNFKWITSQENFKVPQDILLYHRCSWFRVLPVSMQLKSANYPKQSRIRCKQEEWAKLFVISF